MEPGIHATIVNLYGLTFGTHEQRKRMLDRIYSSQQQQRRLSQTTKNGINHLNPYPQDPKLRLWIAATLYVTATEMYQRVVHELSFKEAELVYSEFTVLLNVSLNLPKGLWPTNRAAFWAYWDEHVEKLDVDTRARPVAHDLEAFRNMPSWVKVSQTFIRSITSEMLPPHVREQYGFTSSPTSRFMYRMYMGGS